MFGTDYSPSRLTGREIMAIYTTLFACPFADLVRGFTRWREPLVVPVLKTRKNPLTGQFESIMSREPTWENPVTEIEQAVEYQATEISGDYSTYLEKRIPTFVRSCAHWCWKGLTELELEELSRAVGIDEACGEVALYAPPSFHATLTRLNPKLIERLAGLSDSQMEDVACLWATAMSSSEHTRSVTGNIVGESWSTEYAMQLLESLTKLVTVAIGKLDLYLLTEW